MDVIDRQTARSNGLTHYFTGRECRNHHIAERYVSTGSCVECMQEHALKTKIHPSAFTKTLSSVDAAFLSERVTARNELQAQRIAVQQKRLALIEEKAAIRAREIAYKEVGRAARLAAIARQEAGRKAATKLTRYWVQVGAAHMDAVRAYAYAKAKMRDPDVLFEDVAALKLQARGTSIPLFGHMEDIQSNIEWAAALYRNAGLQAAQLAAVEAARVKRDAEFAQMIEDQAAQNGQPEGDPL